MSIQIGIVGPHTLARALRTGPPLPTGVVGLLSSLEVELQFQELVRRLLPDEAETILRPLQMGRHRDAERSWAFCSAFERRYFPIYEVDEIAYLVPCIPFQRMGWSYDAFHDLHQRPGTLMLRALCAEPYESAPGARVPLLEAVESLGLPRELLLRVPADGLSPADLHAALDGTPRAAAAEFADWTWGQTDLAFLDFDDDVEVADADWSQDTIQELAQQWHRAQALMERVDRLEVWLEQDPARHFAELLEAALVRSPDPPVDASGSNPCPGTARACSSTTETLSSSSPYRRLLPRDADIETDPLLLRLDFHRESVVLHDYADGVASSRLVSALDIAHALASELDLDTGLLPPEALWYVKTATGPRVALWCPPRVWTVRLQEVYGQRPRRFRLPMPGLVFQCLPAAQAPYVFAARSRPRTGDDELYHCPTWNVFRNGRVCPGTHVFPRDPARVPEDFFKSHFSPTGDSHGRSRAHPDDLLSLWTELHRQATYPLDDLMPALRLGDALRIGA